MHTIGTCVANRRIALGLSQQEVANAVGKSQAAVSLLEADRINPSIGLLRMLAGTLQIKMSEILGETP